MLFTAPAWLSITSSLQLKRECRAHLQKPELKPVPVPLHGRSSQQVACLLSICSTQGQAVGQLLHEACTSSHVGKPSGECQARHDQHGRRQQHLQPF